MQLDLVQVATQLRESSRPVLIHLNADTTWLLSVPYPDHGEKSTTRTRFNVLIDPWLRGPQVDQAGWFSKQWHAIESSVQHVSEIEQLLRQAESTPDTPSTNEGANYIDVVVVSHEFTDHCHEATLKEVGSEVPVFATSKAAKLIQSWSYFKTVKEIPPFTSGIDWHKTSDPLLPAWIGISRLINEKDALYYHSAVIFYIATSNDEAEAVIYTPHGVEADSFSALTTTQPLVKPLALLHGLHDVSLRFAAQLNLGAHNALKAQRLLLAKYWVGTHDEVKKGRGVVAAWLKRRPYTLRDALTHEAANLTRGEGKEELAKDVPFVELDSGQVLILE